MKRGGGVGSRSLVFMACEDWVHGTRGCALPALLASFWPLVTLSVFPSLLHVFKTCRPLKPQGCIWVYCWTKALFQGYFLDFTVSWTWYIVYLTFAVKAFDLNLLFRKKLYGRESKFLVVTENLSEIGTQMKWRRLLNLLSFTEEELCHG